jgi:trehalose 6-phosphate phosphatase
VLPSPPHELLSGASLLLDLDGTLVEIASKPDGIRVDHRLHQLLAGLSRQFDGRLAIISGRPVGQLRAYFPELSLTFAGSHGIEILWPDGRKSKATEASLEPRVLERLRRFEAEHPGVLVEGKPFGAAIHYRLAPAAEEACRRLAAEVADENGYALQAGKKVFELKIDATDKGDAVRALMSVPPMRGTRPVFIGDDETDEAAFRMASRLGGAGVLVGAFRPTNASYRLETVEETLLWLEMAGGVAA